MACKKAMDPDLARGVYRHINQWDIMSENKWGHQYQSIGWKRKESVALYPRHEKEEKRPPVCKMVSGIDPVPPVFAIYTSLKYEKKKKRGRKKQYLDGGYQTCCNLISLLKIGYKKEK
ncbi:uncharacterized protein CIMG_13374 [Coccidioides immitis RS]|uniref:Uncharacterized protein n=1 Tax=Coccidioides immitis (strain RS) TaxID=246410 RepID=A0A0D8JV18_COCIM|nr:uncharacterized protein CIMG_13374 [Coccidioides immitis RS]KJF61004.1 hypothetical protein CIMG_13374 [Coccidioides immitis RS]